MGTARLKDMIVIVPGILGSTLKSNSSYAWKPSSPGFLGGRAMGFSLNDLTLSNKLVADSLIKIPFGLRNLMGCIGYDLLADSIKSYFNIKSYSANSSNLHEFPYDWRLDNRISAKKMKEFVEERISLWRDESGYHDAKVIILAHSMGGLVSRYYLEKLDGIENCNLLVTFGTPHRGAGQLHELARCLL